MPGKFVGPNEAIYQRAKEEDEMVVALDPNDEFDRVLIEIKAMHDKKKHDYSGNLDRFFNFQFAAQCAGVSTETVFEILLGVKQARLITLGSNKVPKNESIHDTLLDRAVYSILAYAYSLRE